MGKFSIAMSVVVVLPHRERVPPAAPACPPTGPVGIAGLSLPAGGQKLRSRSRQLPPLAMPAQRAAHVSELTRRPWKQLSQPVDGGDAMSKQAGLRVLFVDDRSASRWNRWRRRCAELITRWPLL